MPGDYVVPTRLAGTLITELIYNNDHQNHVDGRSAEEMGSFGVSSSQFQLTEDPEPLGVPALPPSLAGEITRLRFVMAQIKGELSGGSTVAWYQAMTSPGLPFLGARVQRTSALAIPDAAGTPISFSGATEDFNTGVWDGLGQPTRFTAPFAGKYMAFASVDWAVNNVGRRALLVAVNNIGSQQQRISNLPATLLAQPQAVTALLDLQAADYVQFFAFQNSGGNLNLLSVGSESICGGLVFLGT